MSKTESVLSKFEWRDPIFHYDPNTERMGVALQREFERISWMYPSSATREVLTDRFRLWIQNWEAVSAICGSSNPYDNSQTNVRLPSAPFTSVIREGIILDEIGNILAQGEIESFIEAGRNFDISRGDLKVPLKNGGEWVDHSSGGHSSSAFSEGDSAQQHFFDSMNTYVHSPLLAATLLLADRSQRARILFVACSYGLGVKALESAGFEEAYGIDIDARAIEFGRQQGLKVEVMDANEISFESDSFDMVVSRNFLVKSYVPYPYIQDSVNRAPIYNEMCRVTKEGGFVIFTSGISRPLDHRDLPLEEIQASDLNRSRRFIETGVVPLFSEDQHLYPIWIFQK